MNKKFFLPLLVGLLAIIVFWPTTKTYFSQDDWVFLSYVYKRPLLDIFRYHPESIYRPIGQQLFFWVNSKFFGLNSSGYHLAGLGIHVLNIFLLFRLLIFRDKNLDLPIIFLFLAMYGLNPLHFVALNWLTQIDLEIAVGLSLGTLLIYKKHRILAIMPLILAMLSHEIALVVPFMAGILYGWSGLIGIMLVVVGLIGAGKYLLNPFPLTHDYEIGLNPVSIINTIKWYWLRALSIPEGVKELPVFLKYFSLTPALLMVSIFRLRLIKGLGFFIIGLIPVLLLTKHAMAAYAVLALALMVMTTGINASHQLKNHCLTILAGLTITVASFFVIQNIHQTHWSTNRGELAKTIGQEYKTSDKEGKERIKKSSGDYINNSEIYFATMMGKQFEVMSR